MAFITVKDLQKDYYVGDVPVHALQPMSFGIEEAEFIAVMGPSGSGKSTILSVLGALNYPTGGKVLIDEIDVFDLGVEQRSDFRREYIGFVFQSFQLLSYLSALENVMLPLAVLPCSNTEKRSMASDIIHRVGLDEKSQRLPGELSGGEQQRVAIARALVNRPPVILADEPTGNLDTSTSREIMELLKTFNKDGHTCIMVTHNQENLQFADRCIHLRDGKLTDDFTTHPANHAVVASRAL